MESQALVSIFEGFRQLLQRLSAFLFGHILISEDSAKLKIWLCEQVLVLNGIFIVSLALLEIFEY
jgi:hypothetical protein